MTLRRPVLLYDAGWRFCRWAARVAARVDRRRSLAFLPLDDPEAVTLLRGLPEEERNASWRLVKRDGTTISHGIARGRLPDALYGLVARHRDRLGLIVPDGAAPRRYP